MAGATVSVANGLITSIGNDTKPDGDVFDLKGCTLYPGFIDIHCHGAAGIDVNTAGADGLRQVSEHLASKGVTGWLPTLVPDRESAYSAAVGAIADLIESGYEAGARVLGVHYEGVFANSGRCGALRTEFFRKAEKGFLDLPVPQTGARLTTLAPEIDGGTELVRRMVSAGWIVAIGHTEATRQVLDKAFDAGARHVTHLFNAMSGIHHREPGVAGWAISREGVTFDIIADGRHVDPSVVLMAINARGTDSSVLISDSIALAGLTEGDYDLWGKRIRVSEGIATDPSGTLSGSVISMLDAVSLCASLGFDDQAIAAMSSMNPARILGLESECGSVEAGKRADLVALKDGRPVLTLVGGNKAYLDL